MHVYGQERNYPYGISSLQKHNISIHEYINHFSHPYVSPCPQFHLCLSLITHSCVWCQCISNLYLKIYQTLNSTLT